jgi:exosortase family protein XrtF
MPKSMNALNKLINTIKYKYKKQNRLNKFLIKGGGLLVVYQILKIILIRVNCVKPFTLFFTKGLIKIIVKSSWIILKLIGEQAETYRNIVYITGSEGVRVIPACLAVSLMALFAGFIICYPGEKKSKLWYIPLGIILIMFLNILRIMAMALLSYHAPELLNFYHRYVFKFMIHGFILLLWIIWINKYGIKEKIKSNYHE